ncbi:ras-related and estrogen-regulated growth inhibitor-like protein isoform X2 [Daphnia pulex]|uniref:ras-related and estrogen-regulated growth inhibitor-like protein isoform X2 n=1 Tax=Daphnia pulex TaxID=6669 RepID=UPI001EE018B2|nr:ras-related and estrogen-regulated growth inhibitor-like protein isoform X2 [Daphnia pulex]
MDNNNTTDGQRKATANRDSNAKTKMRLDEKITSVAFGRSTKIDSDKNAPRIRICVLGFAAVGKTAVVVRYLTNRFIGEYCSGKDLLYKKTIKIDGFPSQIEIADTSNKSADLSFPSVHVSWADACIIVYSIESSASFEAAATMLEKIQSIKMPFYHPVLLLANQKDLEHLRQVRVEDGQALALQNNCHFAELSAAEDLDGVELTMTALFRDVRTLKSQRTAVRQKKPSLMHVTKLFSSLIGRSSSSSSFNETDAEKPKLKSSSTASSLHTGDECEIKVNTPTEKEVKSNKGIKKRPSFSL